MTKSFLTIIYDTLLSGHWADSIISTEVLHAQNLKNNTYLSVTKMM